MLKKLATYYQREGISALGFRCPFVTICSKGYERFTETREAFVGTEYEKGSLPRLLFISLDPGSSSSDPTQRTAEFVRHSEETKCDVAKLPKNRHWYRTHELAFILLKRMKPDLKMEDTHLYFAHANSVKCCANNDNHKQASHILFENCRRYIGGETAVLNPDILVTQGKWAKEAVEKAFRISEVSDEEQSCFYAWALIGDKKVLWFHTYHPRNFGKFHKQRRECFEKWAKVVYRTFQ